MTSSRDKGNTQKEIIPSVDEESLKKMSKGGYDNKYRKLRGIGEYTQRENEPKVRREQSETSSEELANILNERMLTRQGGGKSEARDNAGVADKRQRKSDKSEYP